MTRLKQRCSLDKANSSYRNYSLWSFMVTVTDLGGSISFPFIKANIFLYIIYISVLLIRQDTLTVH